MPKPYPREFRDDVVRVARSRDPKTPLEQIAKDFGIHQTTLNSWMRKADVEEGTKPGMTEDQNAEFRELKRRNRLLEQEVEVLRTARPFTTSSLASRVVWVGAAVPQTSERPAGHHARAN